MDLSGAARHQGQRSAADTLVRLFSSRYDGPTMRVREVVRDSSRWQVWSSGLRLHTDSALPPVDFSRYMVVVAGMGSVASTGFELFVDSVHTSGSKLLVYVRSVDPGGCSVGGAETRPIDIVRVPRTTLRVRFLESTETNRCE